MNRTVLAFILGFILGLAPACLFCWSMQKANEAAMLELLDCSVTTGWIQHTQPDGKSYWIPQTAKQGQR